MQKLYKMIKELRQFLIKDEYCNPLINDIEEYARDLTMKEKLKNTSGTQRYNTIKRILKRNKNRVALTKVKYDDDGMWFTDVYIAFHLIGKDIIEGFPAAGSDYPNLAKLFYYKSTALEKHVCSDLKKKIKVDEYITFGDTTVEAKLLSEALTVLGFKNDDIVSIYTTGEIRPIKIINENGSECLVTAVRVKDE